MPLPQMTKKRLRRDVDLLPTFDEAALYFADPDDLGAALALRGYRERTGADLEQFRAGLRLLWAHHAPRAEGA